MADEWLCGPFIVLIDLSDRLFMLVKKCINYDLNTVSRVVKPVNQCEKQKAKEKTLFGPNYLQWRWKPL